MESGVIGSTKHYKVKLKNGEVTFLSENHMREYFPRKLFQYYSSMIQKLSKTNLDLNIGLEG